ncbi:MAG TPA: DUF4126 family protein [Candidatus Saccharimonadales bacterium]|nr:DUF4126 family protein [Candidatus Saccharimonadales bacterium]
MTPAIVLALAFGIGVIAGLRAFTAPTVVAWAAYLGWMHLHHTRLGFLGSLITVVIFTLLAVFELVNDKRPTTPSRTEPGGLIARIVTGGFSGAAIGVASGQLVLASVLLAAVGAVAGAFGGYQIRSRTVRALGVPDYRIAVIEDLVAIGGGLLLVSRF